MNYDAVIIGSGMAGLTSALLLARNGLKTAILEKESQPAPLLRTFKRQGYFCEPGFHYSGGFEEDGVLTLLLKYFGVESELQAVELDEECFDIITVKGLEPFRLPYGFDNLKRYFCNRFPEGADAVNRYFDSVASIRESDFLFNHNKEFISVPEEIFDTQSLAEFLESIEAPPLFQAMVGKYGKALYGSSASDISLFIHSLIMSTFYHKVYSILGGGKALVNAMEEACKKWKVDIYGKESATEFITDKRQLKGIRTDRGREFRTERCISTIHPHLLPPMFPEHSVRPAFINRINRQTNSFSFCISFFGVEPEDVPQEIKTANNFLMADNDECNYMDYWVMYLDPRHVPGHNKAVTVVSEAKTEEFRPFLSGEKSPSSPEYAKLKEKYIKKHQEDLFSLYPELNGKARFLEMSTPVSYQRYTGTADGAIYGLARSVKQRNLGYKASLNGLYLAGQSIIPGILGSAISSLFACSGILDMEEVWRDIKKCR